MKGCGRCHACIGIHCLIDHPGHSCYVTAAEVLRDRMHTQGWIGVDLDGTLAEYDHWRGIEHIGDPIAPMVERVKHWLAEGKDVRIFTARVCPGHEYRDPLEVRQYIYDWCLKHLGRVLPVTHEKDMQMIELWDDRAIQIITNTGERADGKL